MENVIGKTFRHKGSISFEEFLNLQLEVAEAIDPSGYIKSPRETLMGLLRQYLLPLSEEVTQKLFLVDDDSRKILNEINSFLSDL